MATIWPDKHRPPAAFKTKLVSTALPSLEGAAWFNPMGGWGILSSWPIALIDGKQNGDPKTLFNFEFAVGAYLDAWTDVFQSEEFWAGTAPPTEGPIFGSSPYKSKEGAAWDILRAKAGDQINAVFQDAHARNRWDLLEVWYPLVWDRMARAEVPFVSKPPQKWKLSWLEIRPWPGWPEMDKVRAKHRLLYESGDAAKWMESIYKKRQEDGLPTPPWMGPWVKYVPNWWIVPNSSTAGVQVNIPEQLQLPGRWRPSTLGSFTAQLVHTKLGVIYPFGDISQSDKINDFLVGTVTAAVVGAMLGGFVTAAWSSLGAPVAPVLTDSIAAGLQGELMGGGFEDGFLDSFIPGVGTVVNDLGGSQLFSTAADLAAGNLDTQDGLMLLDSFTDGLDWLDNAFDSASGFIEQVGDIGSNVDGLANLFGFGDDTGYIGSNGYPSAPPIFEPNEAGGGTPATAEQLADWEKDGMLPIILIGIALLVIA